MSIEHGETPPQKEPIVATVDLSECWDKESMRDILIEQLKKLGIYRPNLLFRSFNGSRIAVVKQHGTDNPKASTVFCSKESELADQQGMEESSLDFVLNQKKVGLAVYEGEKLEQRDVDPTYRYRAKVGTNLKEALLAVFILE